MIPQTQQLTPESIPSLLTSQASDGRYPLSLSFSLLCHPPLLTFLPPSSLSCSHVLRTIHLPPGLQSQLSCTILSSGTGGTFPSSAYCEELDQPSSSHTFEAGSPMPSLSWLCCVAHARARALFLMIQLVMG